MIRKKSVILEAYREHTADFLDTLTIQVALEKRGIKMTKRGLSNFIRNSLENKYLVPSRDAGGIIVGWTFLGEKKDKFLKK